MANLTMKSNRALIEKLQKEQTETIEDLAEMGQKVLGLFQVFHKNQRFIASVLEKLLGFMILRGSFQDMLTHRARWKELQKQLKEVTNAENTEAEGDGADKAGD